MRETEGPPRRGRPLGRWKDMVKEYMCERSASSDKVFEQAEGVSG